MDIANLSDEQLAVAIREKDQELYGEIIRRYQGKLSRYLRRFVVNEDELDDVLQNVFIKAYRNLYGFDEKRKFSSWIYRIAHNEALNWIRKNYKESVPLDEMEYKIIDEKIDLKKEIDARLAKEKIEKALAEMKNKYREPLELFFLIRNPMKKSAIFSVCRSIRSAS